MGVHAFDHEPAHCAVYRDRVGPDLPALHGLAELWNMPASRHRRALGAGIEFRGVDHYVLTYHIGGSAARRSGMGRGEALVRALSLQRPGSGGTFSSRGVVDYAHLYFRQGLLTEIAEETGQRGADRPEDFFGLTDATLASDASSYIRRAADTRDPPSAIEMDGRAYLIGLGLMRAVQARSGAALELAVRVGRADLRAVLCMIEDRIGEELRLSDLARLVGMSPFHFARVFKAEVGETPARYILARRIDRALALIRDSRLPLAEIAFRTGFSSQPHLTRHIKDRTGTTPARLRVSVGQ